MIADLTEGVPSKKVLNLALPMVLSMVFQQLYNIVDTIIVGRFVGADAIYAVGASYPVTMIFMAIATGAGIGLTVAAGKHFGAKHFTHLKTTVSTTLIFMSGISVVLMIIGALCSNLILSALTTPPEIMQWAKEYLQIFFYGLPFIFVYNVANGAFAAIGDTRTSLVFLIISSVLNIALDLVFVVGCGMGVVGAALATLISQFCAALPAVLVLYKRLKPLDEGQAPIFSAVQLKTVLHIAVPSMIQYSFVAVGNLLVQSRVNHFSENNLAVGAAYTAAIKLNSFAVNCFTTMGNATSSFTAQNLAAGKKDRVKKGHIAGIIISCCIALPFVLIYCLAGEGAINIFMDKTTSADFESVIKIGSTFLRIVSPFYIIIPLKIISDGVLRGSEKMAAFMTSTFLDLFLRVALAFLLSATALNETGIWLSWPIGWVCSTIFSIVCYFVLIRKWRKGDYVNGRTE